MYLFGAQLQARRGMGPEAAEYMTKVRDLVSSATGIPSWAWAGAAGVPIGTFYLSARFESFEQYLTANQAISQNTDYHALLKTGADLVEGPAQTVMGRVVGMAGELGEEPAPLVAVTTATAAPGRQADAVAWGVNMLDYTHGVTGTPGLFTTSAVGSFSDVSWIISYQDAAAIDSDNDTMMTDAGYLERMGSAGAMFVAGSAQRSVLAKLP